MLVLILSILLVLSGLFLKTYHLLSFFISLEVMSVCVLMGFSFLYFFFVFDFFLMLLFLCILGCESVVGLVLFVLFSRFFSKDYYLSVGVLKF